MGSELIHAVLRRIRTLAGADDPSTDGQLLRQFANSRDPAAFDALLAKYGPLVFGVCRRVLGNGHDAEDAFQATFLVLARRAGALDGSGTVAGWLHAVAYHVAVRARTDAVRRRQREAQVAVPASAARDEASWSDLRPVIDEELSRLPDKYRLPVVMCYLEGRTQEEVAAQLGWTKGTVSGRLARAKETLRDRLDRRGLSPTDDDLSRLAGPAVPPALLQSTLSASVAGSTEGAAAVLAQAFLQRWAVAKTLSLAALGLVLAVGTYALVALASTPRVAPPVERPSKAHADQLGDPLPPHALARLGTVRLAHGRGVRCAAFSPDGKLLAASDHGTNSPDDSIRIWDTATGKEHGRLPGVAQSLAFSPDGKRLAASNEFHVLSVWDVTTGNRRWRWDASREKDAPKFAGVAFAPDGRTVAVAVADGTLRLRSADTGKETHRVGTKATELAFSPDGKTLAAADTWGNTVTLLDPATGKVRHTLAQESRVNGLAFSPDSASILVATDGSQLVLWDVAGGKQIRQMRGPGHLPIRILPDGRSLRSGQYTVDLTTGKHWKDPDRDDRRIAMSPDGRIGASGGSAIHLWDETTGRELVALDRHGGAIRFVVPSADGKTITTVGQYDEQIRDWDAVTGKALAVRKTAPWPRFAAVSADGKILATPHYNKEYALVELSSLNTIEGGEANDRVGAMALSADAGLLAVVSGDKQRLVRIWDAARGKLLQTLPARPAGYGSLTFSADGKRLITGSSLEEIETWDVGTGQRLPGPRWQPVKRERPMDHSIWPEELRRHGLLVPVEKVNPSPTAALAISPAGDALAVASGFHRHYYRQMGDLPDSALVRVYDLSTGKERFQLYLQEAVVAFSPDGKLLATGGHGDDAVYLWDAVSGKQRRRFVGHGGAITALAFTADGRRLVSGSADGTGLVWDVAGSP